MSLADLCVEWRENKVILDRATAEDTRLKKAIREAAAAEETLDWDGPTAHLAGVSITRSEPGIPGLVPNVLLERLGPENFCRAVNIKAVELNLDAWRAMLAEELVTDTDLLESMGEAPAARAWSIGLSKRGA